ncbi:MAG TPA: PhzF family phenazine biosynthesis protein [Candidatus Anaerotignum merdipullorum]|nr:PhzF family phenazine biosynthesis protein [Candidatus Anaerotignum merdipullorum]
MLKYYVADAFADDVFEGNPAGVCVLDEWLPLEKMAKIAMENNLSETGFAVKEKENPCTYGLRWFTPTGEIDLCGHCTFGTAYILFRFFEQNTPEIHFDTKKCGYHLIVEKHGDMLTMDFPSIMPEPYTYEEYMGDGVGAVPSEVYRTERDLVLIYDSAETVRNLKPDFSKIKEFPYGLSVYVTAKSDDTNYDFVARAFWPKINVNEDPVCGSMHCALTPFWKARLGKDKMAARSLSARGGTVYCEDCGERVKLSGRGALYLVGNILCDEAEVDR